jgi:hypothetical protein
VAPRNELAEGALDERLGSARRMAYALAANIVALARRKKGPTAALREWVRITAGREHLADHPDETLDMFSEIAFLEGAPFGTDPPGRKAAGEYLARRERVTFEAIRKRIQRAHAKLDRERATCSDPERRALLDRLLSVEPPVGW